MSNKLNAEELAEKRYPAFRFYETYSHRRGYATAIREVAQPIADQRDELLEALKKLERIYDYYPPEGAVGVAASRIKERLDEARAVINKVAGK